MITKSLFALGLLALSAPLAHADWNLVIGSLDEIPGVRVDTSLGSWEWGNQPTFSDCTGPMLSIFQNSNGGRNTVIAWEPQQISYNASSNQSSYKCAYLYIQNK